VNAEGYREILGVQTSSAESRAGWLAFFRDLVARGLTGVALVTSDVHSGLVEAIGATLPGASWQRCRTHYAANLMSACPKSSWSGVKTLLHSVYDQPDAAAVHAQFDRVIDALTGKLPAVTEHLEQARADILAVAAFPKEIRRQIWSNGWYTFVAADALTMKVREARASGPAHSQRTAEPGDSPPHRRRRDLLPPRDHPVHHTTGLDPRRPPQGRNRSLS